MEKTTITREEKGKEIARVEFSLNPSGGEIRGEWIWVAESHRKRGLAKGLWQEVIDKYITNGDYKSIHCFTRESNTPTMRLYKSLGFKEVLRIPHFYLPVSNQEASETVVMYVYNVWMKSQEKKTEKK